MAINIQEAMNNELLNMVDALDDEVLETLGSTLKDGFKEDEKSREQWMNENHQWMKLATQYKEKKTFPWPGAANIKYPVVTTAAMQFSARAYPALVPNKKPVKSIIVGKEEEEVNAAAGAVAAHMNYQLMYEMPNWEEDMDKLCLILPITGTAFKKTYYDPVSETNVSELVLAKDVVVNYWAKSIEKASRVSHILELSPDMVQTRIRKGVFADVDYQEPSVNDSIKAPDTNRVEAPSSKDDTTPYTFIECHCRYDLDDDGYPEPYIVTFELSTGKVARVIPRFHEESVEWSEDNEVIAIEPINYFTKFSFIPNPDGGFYDMGFGLLLGTLNETINTAINQLLDAGTLSTLQAGFLGKGIRIRGGDYKLSPNEWKTVNANVDDLRKHIFPLPIKEPSQVLFNLLGMLIQSSKELASISEIFVGKMPGQNTPATTTMETVKQGMAVFTAIYKRVYRSLDQEYKKLFNLNKLYMDDEITHPVDLNREQYKMAYLTVIPTADPDAASDAEKMEKAGAMMQLASQGQVNPQVATKMMLDAMRIENQKELLTMPEPQPSPEEKKMEHEMKMKEADLEVKKTVENFKARAQAEKQDNEMKLKQFELQFKEKAHEQEMRHAEQIHQLKVLMETQMAELKLEVEEARAGLDAEVKIATAETDILTKKAKAAADTALSQQKKDTKKES